MADLTLLTCMKRFAAREFGELTTAKQRTTAVREVLLSCRRQGEVDDATNALGGSIAYGYPFAATARAG